MLKNPSYTCTLIFPNGRKMNRAGEVSGYTTREILIGLIKHPFGEDVEVSNLKLKDPLTGKEIVDA